MTLSEILNLEAGDVAKLSRKELAPLVSKLKAQSKARTQRLIKYEKREGYKSPALNMLSKNDLSFTVRGTSLNKLRNEFMKYSKFLKAKTSTISGLERYREKTRDIFGERNADNPDYMDLFSEFKQRYENELLLVPSQKWIIIFNEVYENGYYNTKEELFEQAITAIRGYLHTYTDDLEEDFWEYDEEDFEDF